MTISEFEELLSRFDSLAKDTKVNLESMLSLISEGKVPLQDDIAVFDCNIGLLSEAYGAIVDASKQILPEQDIPAPNSTVSAYASAVKENAVLVMQMKVQYAKQVLNDFLRVKSLVEAYTVAIAPYQNKAKEIFTSLSSENPGDIESAIDEIKPTELFLKALRCEDLDSDEGIAILEEVSETFPRRVQLGLQGNKYYIEDGESIIDQVDSEDSLAGLNTNLPEVISKDMVDVTPMDETPRLVEETETANIDEVAPLVDNISKDIDEEDSGVSLIDEPVSDNHEEVVSDVTIASTKKIKNSTPSASAFKNNVLAMPRNVQDILPLFTNLAIMTAKQVHTIGVCMDCFDDSGEAFSAVNNTLTMLTNKGFLAAYDLGEDIGLAYCLTNYCNACLKKESISKLHLPKSNKQFWNVSFGQYRVCGTDEISQQLLLTAIEEVDNLLNYIYDVKTHILVEDYEKIKESILHIEGGYRVGVYTDEGFVLCLAASEQSKENTEYPLLFVEQCPDVFADSASVYIYRTGKVYIGNSDTVKEEAEIETVDEPIEVLDTTHDVVLDEPDDSAIQEEAPVIVTVEEPIVTKENTVVEDTPIAQLISSKNTPRDSELYDIIVDLLEGNGSRPFAEHSSVIQALMLAKTAALIETNSECQNLYQKLIYSTRIAPEETRYTSENIAKLFLGEDELERTMMFSAYVFGLLVPGRAYDYALKSQADVFLRGYDSYFPHLNAVKPLFAKLNTIRDIIATGYTEGVLSRIGSEAESERYIKELQTVATGLLNVSAPKTRMKALPKLYNMCFGKNSDLYDCLEIISANETPKVDLVNMVLEEYCDEENGSYTISMVKTVAKLNDFWFKANGQDSSFDLEYAARQQALRQFTTRLDVIKSWAEHISVVSDSKHDLPRLKQLKEEIIQLAGECKDGIRGASIKGKNIILWVLDHIEKYLSSPTDSLLGVFDEFAITGIFTLDSNRRPVVWEDMSSVKYYEPWRNVLKHIASPISTYDQARAEILDGGEASDLFDNLRQLEIIDEIVGEKVATSQKQIDDALDKAKDCATKFDEALELAYTYDRIKETEKENLAGIKKQYMAAFFDGKDFGTWRQFLKALKTRIDELTEARKAELQRMLDARFASPGGADSPVLMEAKNLLERDLNFAVAEEYINRFDRIKNGESSSSEELQSVLHDRDHFAEFITDKVFSPIYNECLGKRGGNFQNFAEDYLKKTFPSDWTSGLKDDSIKLIKNWPLRKGKVDATQISALLVQLGFVVTGSEKLVGKKEDMFKVSLEASPRSKADYRHPISAFGTQMKSHMIVTVLYGYIPAKQLVDTITGMGLGTMSIVILNYPLNLAVRRQIAEEFHKTTGDNPFILIDQVLAIYLAQHQITERLPVMLKCTLPFTKYQPFAIDGGFVADEMFCGRARELATIKDPNGACVVYGGRQLGKTALLQRAESLCFKPENKAYAVYCSISNCITEASMVQQIAEDVEKKTGLSLGECSTIKELRNGFECLFKNGRMESMLLLLDETDKFLASIADQKYAQLQPLIDFKRSTQNKFKFVLAGLHDVCRAKNATERNGVFGQLGTPLCVKPLSPTDALQLLSRPLRYLGFQIDRDHHLETILTRTNYYPGILQFFGYKLVETLATHYGKYYRAVDGNPPYTLRTDQLGAVMNSADLNNSIHKRFRMSLELDERYFMIARCIAVLYYLNEKSTNTWLGFSIDEIMEIAKECDIHCLENTRKKEYENLLDEMVEMGILSKPDDKKDLYRLRRSSFIDIIGSDFDAVYADITNSNKEAE